jgi:hypothetical protein
MNTNDPKNKDRISDSAKNDGQSNGKHTFSSNPSDYSYGTKVPSSDGQEGWASGQKDSARVNKNGNKGESMNKNPFNDNKSENSPGSKGPEDLYHYAKSNKEQTITYILLVLGLLAMLLFDTLFGGLIIGMVAGYYFSHEIINYLRNFNQIFSEGNRLRSVVLAALLLAFFVAAPGVFIGAGIVALFKQVVQGPGSFKDSDKK